MEKGRLIIEIQEAISLLYFCERYEMDALGNRNHSVEKLILRASYLRSINGLHPKKSPSKHLLCSIPGSSEVISFSSLWRQESSSRRKETDRNK